MVILELLYMITLASVFFFFISYLHKKGKLKAILGTIAVFIFALLCIDTTDSSDI